MAGKRTDRTIRKQAKKCNVGRPRVYRSGRVNKNEPLSQYIFGNLKDWTINQARRAINVEREFKKKLEKTLAIKFPKPGVTKERVASLHPAIQDVYLLEPKRSECIVTLKESANPHVIVSLLNKKKIGKGFLSVAYKENRDEDPAKAKDIDPLTLYVSNVKFDLLDKYMNNKFMKSRGFQVAHESGKLPYGYVIYEDMEQVIENFKKLYIVQIYYGNFIVRFRRLKVD